MTTIVGGQGALFRTADARWLISTVLIPHEPINQWYVDLEDCRNRRVYTVAMLYREGDSYYAGVKVAICRHLVSDPAKPGVVIGENHTLGVMFPTLESALYAVAMDTVRFHLDPTWL